MWTRPIFNIKVKSYKHETAHLEFKRDQGAVEKVQSDMTYKGYENRRLVTEVCLTCWYGQFWIKAPHAAMFILFGGLVFSSLMSSSRYLNIALLQGAKRKGFWFTEFMNCVLWTTTECLQSEELNDVSSASTGFCNGYTLCRSSLNENTDPIRFSSVEKCSGTPACLDCLLQPKLLTLSVQWTDFFFFICPFSSVFHSKWNCHPQLSDHRHLNLLSDTSLLSSLGVGPVGRTASKNGPKSTYT